MYLILVSREGEAKTAYLKELDSLRVMVDAVPSIDELIQKMCANPYNGVLVDLVTFIKTPREEKAKVQDVLGQFPVVQLKWDMATHRISTLYYGQAFGEGNLRDFIQNECGRFNARTVRVGLRRSVHLNAVVSRCIDFEKEPPICTVTINISSGGCFLYSLEKWDIGMPVWLKFKELMDDKPIQGEVRWSIPWGERSIIPGIGVHYKNIERQQQDILNKYQ